jgi:lysophospholipase L1-like esterase
MLISPNDRILFQGDSITDCGRAYTDPASLGNGYAMMASGMIAALHPQLAPSCLNRGISGNRVVDLLARWEKDCLKLRPDVLSIMIGINDTWRRYDSNDPTTVGSYERNYRRLLEESKAALPDLKIILMEPFVLPVPDDRRAWREDLDPKIEVVRGLAKEFGATLVQLDGLLNAACQIQSPAYWAEDGVHPSLPGHALIARYWLEAVGALH